MADLYTVLQVAPGAHPDVIAAAYRALARHYHPDTGGSHRAMAALNVAFEVLGDPHRRAAYDARRGSDARGQRAAADAAPAGVRRPASGSSSTAAPRNEPVSTPPRQTPPEPTPPEPTPSGPAAGRGSTAWSRPTLSADGVLGFGRYEGHTLHEVARIHPEYLEWLGRSSMGRRYHEQIDRELERARGGRWAPRATLSRA